MKKCSRCKKILPLDCFYPDRPRAPKVSSRCILCEKDKYKEYITKNREKESARKLRWAKDNREKKIASNKRYKEKHPDRILANDKFRLAFQKKLIKRPDICHDCGKKCGKLPNGQSEIKADHYKGYAKKYWYTVQWVCRRCDGIRNSIRAKDPDWG